MNKFIMIKDGMVVNEVFQEGLYFDKVEGYRFPADYDTVVHDYGDKFSVGEIYSIDTFEAKYPYHKYNGMDHEAVVRAKQDEINVSAQSHMCRPMLYDGNYYGAVEKDRSNMMEKVVELAVISTEKTTQAWITEENVAVELERDAFISIAYAIGKRREVLTFIARQAKDAVAALSGQALVETPTDITETYLAAVGSFENEYSFCSAL